MTLQRARRAGVEIAYDVEGRPADEPVLLIMGLGLQMLFWPDHFRQLLVDRGFQVARFDNRDVGLSTHLHGLGTPSPLVFVSRRWRGYRVADMADDAVGVLDALGWSSAHVVGVSLGGMIAQTLAGLHPDRVRTLTSISSTPDVRIGGAHPRLLPALLGGRGRTREGAARHVVRVFRTIGSPAYARNEPWLREMARQSFDRAHDNAGVRRQLAAIISSPDRRPLLAGVRAPTLVVHGEADLLVRPSGGRATAAAVAGARLVTYPGMGHDLPDALQQPIAEEIAALAARWRAERSNP
ncbi:alpha/beta fold hydrolase [Cryptosporangium minutisporangium]|uniref:Alpha/beta hydrolase n=1 Tax=Cryptosporangium minutisporangium TaxID=113569 RepID=A0ABP6SYV6_9ACTN